MTRRVIPAGDMPKSRSELSRNGSFFMEMFPEMERLLHCNQGFIKNLLLTLTSELLYVCARFLGADFALAK